MKVLCTGNPNKETIASAVSKILPGVSYISLSAGYDLNIFDHPENYEDFRKLIAHYDVFINASQLKPFSQMHLLTETINVWEERGRAGVIINIGSTIEEVEYRQYGELSEYIISKKALRERSWQVSGQSVSRCTHLVLDGLRDQHNQGQSRLELSEVASTIKWIIEQPFQIPLMIMETKTSAK